MQLLAGKSYLDYIIGAGAASEIQGAGLRAEATWFEPTQESWHNGIEQVTLTSSLVATIETDYSFASNMLQQLVYQEQ